MQAYEIDLTDYIVPGTEEQHRQDDNGDLMYEDKDKKVPILGGIYRVKSSILSVFMSQTCHRRENL